MGVVLSPETVKAGLYPEQGAHEVAANMLLDRFMDFRGGDNMWGRYRSYYMVHGSVPEGRSNVTSDVDLCVINSGIRDLQMLVAFRRELVATVDDIQTKLHVSVEAKVMPIDCIGMGREVDPLFLHYLAGLVVGGNVDYAKKWTSGDLTPSLFKPYNLPLDPELVKDSLVNYFAGKHQSLLQPPDDLKATEKQVQRAHELPGRGLSKIAEFMRLAGYSLPAHPSESYQGPLFIDIEDEETSEEEVPPVSVEINWVLERFHADERRNFTTLIGRKYDGIRYLTSVAARERDALSAYRRWYERSMHDSAARGVHAARAMFQLMRSFQDK